ncbi:helix-turn-helix domain-containing protein [Ruegeria arenilitoris]|uniref:helix-turn-helix domain-containing protein n=1 Tax=Ruegeria arenilitoris TaxID=1173585 RepID=UPI0014802B1C|nr:helix-turn-helix transcriptional regulator [Ruegeria arenilitoris]
MKKSTNESIEAVADRLLALREELRLSQQQFADAVGISLRAAQNYERGTRKLPAETLIEISRRFQIDPLWIMVGPEERPRSLGQVGLDQRTLTRALGIVLRAIDETNADVSHDQIANMVAATYKFYMHNASGAGGEDLIASLVAGYG